MGNMQKEVVNSLTLVIGHRLFQVVVELGKFEGKKFKNSHLKDGRAEMEAEPLHLRPFFKRGGLTLNRKRTLAADGFPIMLWWSPLTGENGRLGQCGADACFFTINRTYLHHHRTKAFLFYGRWGFCLSPCLLTSPSEAELLLFSQGGHGGSP